MRRQAKQQAMKLFEYEKLKSYGVLNYLPRPWVKVWLGKESPTKAELLDFVTEKAQKATELDLTVWKVVYGGHTDLETANWVTADDKTINLKELLQAILNGGFCKKLSLTIDGCHSALWC